MAFQNEDGEQSGDLLHSQARIWNHIFSFTNSMSLKCAIQLQIPDIINDHGSPMTLSKLVNALPVHKEKSQFVYRLMRILVHSGFFTIQSLSETYSDNNNNNNNDDDGEKDGYLLTPMSRCLLIQEPLSIRPFLLAMLDPTLMEPWQHMSTWFMNEGVSDNPFHTVYGMSLWDYAGNEPNINHLFNEAMASDAKLVISIILKNYGEVFQGLNSIVDIGGGTGTLAKYIAKAFPNLKCINFDLPHVINGLQGSNNISYVGGDMFQRIPKADAALLKWILHDWNDEECIKILKRCKETIPSKKNGGKVIIIDMVVNHEEKDHKALETQLFWDMQMMVHVKGKERSEKDWAKLFIDAGFNEYKITRVLGLRSLIEVYPK